MVNIIKGNIFGTQCDCIVNTVNCVGFMGKGIALEMSMRYPKMEQEYKQLCNLKKIKIGELWLYDPADSRKKVLNFPTKYDYRFPSKLEYIRQGLEFFLKHYKDYKIKSIAFSMLGATNGKIPPEKSLLLMKEYLNQIDDLYIEIYINDKKCSTRDEEFNKFLNFLATHQTEKNKRIFDLVHADTKILNFTDIINKKITEELPDGTHRCFSVATKKYIQSLIIQLDSNQNSCNAQTSFLF